MRSRLACIILAAGQATRLRPRTDHLPKCLLSVGGQPILQRTVENLLAAGVDQIAVVVGFEGELIRKFLHREFPNLAVGFISNPDFASTDNAYSLWLAREFVQVMCTQNTPNRLLILDGDIVFSKNLLPRVLKKGGEGAVSVRTGGEHDDEEIVVEVNYRREVVRIGKNLNVGHSFGESVGIEVFDGGTAHRLFEVLDRRVRDGHGREEFYEAAYQEMIDGGVRLRAVNVAENEAIEIDTESDLRKADIMFGRLAASGGRLPYDYQTSRKGDVPDELINTYLLRPVAGVLVRLLYRTPVTPNQVTLASIASGLVAAYFYLLGSVDALVAAGLFVTLKDLLDSADGQLARARNQYSRVGRFLDALGDILVSASVFFAIGWSLYARHGDLLFPLLSAAGLLGITLRVSYHVFYQTSALHLQGSYDINRVLEDVKPEDELGEGLSLALQRCYQLLYGWQDRLMLGIDGWCRHGAESEAFLRSWHTDRLGTGLTGFLGFGTELMLLTVCSLFGRLELYLVLNVLVMNSLLILSVLYRRAILSRRLLTADV